MIVWLNIPWFQEAHDADLIMKGEGRDSKQCLKGGRQEQAVGVRRWNRTDATIILDLEQ